MPQDSDLLIQIHSDLKLLTQKIESAFPRDDNDEIDYAGHRQYHKERNTEAEDYKKSKNAIVRNVMTWALIGLLTIVASTIGEAYIVPAVKILFVHH